MLQHKDFKCPKCGKNMSHGFTSKAMPVSFIEPCELAKTFSIKGELCSRSCFEKWLGSSKWYLAYHCNSCSIHIVCYKDILKREEARILAKEISNGAIH